MINKSLLYIVTFIICLCLSGCSRQEKPAATDTSGITAEPANEDITDKPRASAIQEKPTITDRPVITDAPIVTQPTAGSKDVSSVTPSPADSPDVPSATQPPAGSKDVPCATQPPAGSNYLTSAPQQPTDSPDVPSATQPPAGSKDDGTDNKSSEEDYVSKLDLSDDVSQLVCVIGNGGASCKVSFHIKDDAGIWSQLFSTDGECGSKGITYNKKEGDGKTPAGLYSFTMAFGLKADPGAKLPYRLVTEYDYWLDDINSPYYNTWVNSMEIPGDYTSEHLIDHSPQYNYALNINYNPDCTPGKGSAIFLHGFNGLGHTTGCIAVSEKYVKTLVRKTDTSARILIVPGSKDLAKYQ